MLKTHQTNKTSTLMKFRDKDISFDNTKIMGILNVTPDSFSDGGQFGSVDKALEQANKMISDGATFIDVGGESTRPGATEVPLEEELRRVIPVIKAINENFDTIISVDTSKPEVMREAVLAGAGLINDVRALSKPHALETAAELSTKYSVSVCIMHMQGQPETMQQDPKYHDIMNDVVGFFSDQIERLMKAGFRYGQIMLDPGFGFGKTLEHNYTMLKHFGQFTQFDMPVLAGMSRKSMIGNLLNKEIDQRLSGDITCHTVAAMNGASVIRVHDVSALNDAMKVVDKLNKIK